MTNGIGVSSVRSHKQVFQVNIFGVYECENMCFDRIESSSSTSETIQVKKVYMLYFKKEIVIYCNGQYWLEILIW